MALSNIMSFGIKSWQPLMTREIGNLRDSVLTTPKPVYFLICMYLQCLPELGCNTPVMW